MIKNPPFFSVKSCPSDTDMRLIKDMYYLTKKDFEFLNYIKEILLKKSEEGESEISIDDINIDEIKTLNGLRKKLNKFSDKGVFDKNTEKREHWFRPVTIYSFKSIVTSRNLSNFNNESLLIKKPLSSINDVSLGDFFIQIMFMGLSMNHDDRIKSKEEFLTLVGERVSVEISSIFGSGRNTATIYDFRFFLSALGICENEIIRRLSSDEPNENFFIIETLRINSSLKRENSGGNIATLLRSFERLSETTFFLNEWPSLIKDRYGLEETFLRITPITNLSIQKEKKGIESNKTYLGFSIPHSIFMAISKEKLSLVRVNPSLLIEKNEVIFVLNMFMRKIFAGTNMLSYGPRPLHELGESIAKHMSYYDFKNKLFTGLEDIYKTLLSQGDIPVDTIVKKGTKKFSEKESLRSKLQVPVYDEQGEMISYFAEVYGFYFKISGNEYSILIKNKNVIDTYVGNSSLSLIKNNQENYDDSNVQGNLEI